MVYVRMSRLHAVRDKPTVLYCRYLTERRLIMTQYVVQYGDSLWKISEKRLGNPKRWQEIAKLNQLVNPHQIYVGQVLELPGNRSLGIHSSSNERSSLQLPNSNLARSRATAFPARGFLFIVGDEINSFTKTVVRKIIEPKNLITNPKLYEQIMNPEKYGFLPRDPTTKVPVGRHVLGMTNSKYISTSERILGAPRFEGKRYWINVDKVKKSGGIIHDAEVIAKDLERIAIKTKDPARLLEISEILHKSSILDKEMLIEGAIPAKAVKGALSMGLTTSLKFVTGAAIILTFYDLEQATEKSFNENSIRPLAKETTRQAGGWAASLAAARVGALVGGMITIESGPFAGLGAAVGAVLFGAAGYYGAEWVTDYMYSDENEG